MKWALEHKLASAFVLAIVVLGAAGFASYRSTQEFAEAGKALAHSQEILKELESTLLAIKEAEAGPLAFLASGGETMQSAPTEAFALDARFSRLKELAAGSNERLERVQKLNAYAAREVELLQRLGDSRKESASRGSDNRSDWRTVSALAKEIRTVASAIAHSENETLRRHSETIRVKTRQASIIFLGLAALTAVSIGLAFYRFSRDTRERRRAMEQLRHSEERYRLLAENSLDLIALLDLKGNLIYASSIPRDRVGL